MLRNNNNQLELLDLLSIASFCIGLMNLDENITQGDMQDLEQQKKKTKKKVLDEIHDHLKSQDLKIDEILNRLKELE